MASPDPPAEEIPTFFNFLQFVSDMLGGDLFPLETQTEDIRSIVSHRAIDYELILSIVREVQQHNVVFHGHDLLQAYPTLDALGQVRRKLIETRGDIHQISMVDRIGQLTVSYFNLSACAQEVEQQSDGARVYSLRRRR